MRRRWLAAVSDVRAALLRRRLARRGAGADRRARRRADRRRRDLARAAARPGRRRLHRHGADAARARRPHRRRPSRRSDSPVLEAVEAAGTVVAARPEPAWPCESPTRTSPGDRASGIPLHGDARRRRRRGRRPGTAGRRRRSRRRSRRWSATFADQATVALDKAARQRLARQLDVYEDRDRIARDLHDLVIQRVFAAGLALQSVLPRIARPRGAPAGAGRDRPARRDRPGHPDDDLRPAHDRRPTSTAGASGGGSSTSSPRRPGPTCSRPSGCRARWTAWSPATWPPTSRPSSARRSATSPGTPGRAHVTVTLDVADDVVVEVVDDGRGIDEQRRAQRAAQPGGARRAAARRGRPWSRCPTAGRGCAGRRAAAH